MLSRLVRALWGTISAEELKKFGLLSGVLFFIIGAYWMLREMKNALFMHMVGPASLPYAKMSSLILLVILLLFYNKLIDLFSKTTLVYLMTGLYGSLFVLFSYLLTHPHIGIVNTAASNDRIFGWIMYMTIESFGSIVVALFWSFVASTMDPESAKRGYPVIVSGAQLGSILGSVLIMTQATRLGLPILMLIAAMSVLFVAVMIKIFAQHHYEVTPKLPGAHEQKEDTGVIEGLKLIVTRSYLLGILVVSTVYEIISVILEYQMHYTAKHTLGSLEKVTEFLGFFGLLTNILSFTFAFLGTSFFIRKLGLTSCLVMYPIMIGLLVCSAWAYPVLWTFLVAVVALKGLSYALNNPCKEIMYIPTSRDVKFKAKSWIDVQGGRSVKGIGAGILAMFPVMSELLIYGSIISLAIVGCWIPVALFVGRKNSKLVRDGHIIE